MAGDEDRTWLGKLKRAVMKIRFLLNFNLNRLYLASSFGTSRRLSFNDRPGLLGCEESGSEDSGSSRRLRRTTSYATSSEGVDSDGDGDDDIDKRADAFIANFYKQLRFDRQISLELRYYRRNTFDSSTSTSPSP